MGWMWNRSESWCRAAQSGFWNSLPAVVRYERCSRVVFNMAWLWIELTPVTREISPSAFIMWLLHHLVNFWRCICNRFSETPKLILFLSFSQMDAFRRPSFSELLDELGDIAETLEPPDNNLTTGWSHKSILAHPWTDIFKGLHYKSLQRWTWLALCSLRSRIYWAMSGNWGQNHSTECSFNNQFWTPSLQRVTLNDCESPFERRNFTFVFFIDESNMIISK